MPRMPNAEKRRTICVWVGCCALLAQATAARAEPPAAGPPGAASELTTYTFEDESVVGGTAGPAIEVLTVRQRPERQSLVRVRQHFVRELLKSVEAL